MSAAESWVCEAQLGSGGFGIVHVWKNVATGRKVALKKCKFGSDVTMTARHKAQWCQEVIEFSSFRAARNFWFWLLLAVKWFPHVLSRQHIVHYI
jgi:hypothetical protein